MQLTSVKISDLLKKFPTRADRRNFCREMNLLFPDYPGYDSKFFLQVLQQKKKLLPLGMGPGFTFNYYTKTHQFTKNHIWQFFQGDNELLKYVPDDVHINSLNREHLLAILAYVRKELWFTLYNQYKCTLANASTNKWETYTLQINEEMKAKIESFTGSGNTHNKKPFRLSKRGVVNQDIMNLQVPQVGGGQNVGAGIPNVRVGQAGQGGAAQNLGVGNPGNQVGVQNIVGGGNENAMDNEVSDDEQEI